MTATATGLASRRAKDGSCDDHASTRAYAACEIVGWGAAGAQGLGPRGRRRPLVVVVVTPAVLVAALVPGRLRPAGGLLLTAVLLTAVLLTAVLLTAVLLTAVLLTAVLLGAVLSPVVILGGLLLGVVLVFAGWLVRPLSAAGAAEPLSPLPQPANIRASVAPNSAVACPPTLCCMAARLATGP
jgi:hypothetical protein